MEIRRQCRGQIPPIEGCKFLGERGPRKRSPFFRLRRGFAAISHWQHQLLAELVLLTAKSRRSPRRFVVRDYPPICDDTPQSARYADTHPIDMTSHVRGACRSS